MEEIGRQAAVGFTNSFNESVAAPMSAALSASMGQAVRSAGAQISGLQGAFTSAMASAAAAESAAREAAQMYARAFGSEISRQNIGQMMAKALTSDVAPEVAAIRGPLVEQVKAAGDAMRVQFDEGARQMGRTFRSTLGGEMAGSFREVAQMVGTATTPQLIRAGEEGGAGFGKGFSERAQEFLAVQRFEQLAPMYTDQFSRMGRMANESFTASLTYGFQERAQGMIADYAQFMDTLKILWGQAGDAASEIYGQSFREALPKINSQMRFEQFAPEWTQRFGYIGTQMADALGGGFGARLRSHPAIQDLSSVAGMILPGFQRLFAQLSQGAQSGVEKISELRGEVLKLAEVTAQMGPGAQVYSSKELPGLGAAGEAAASGAARAAAAAWVLPLAEASAVVAKIMVDNMQHAFEFVNREFKTWGNVAKDAAETAMGAFAAVVQGKVPDFQAAFGVISQTTKAAIETPLAAINTGIDMTVGHIPIIGQAFKAVGQEAQQAIEGVFAGIEAYTSIAGQFANVLMGIGNAWQETARTIAGQTLGIEHLRDYLDVVRDIASSGDLVHFKDVASVVGELSQRLTNMASGATLTRDQLTQLATTLAEGNELLGDTKINVDNLTAAFNSFNVPAEEMNGLLIKFVNIARMTGADINELLRDLDLMSPAFQSLGLDAQDSALMMGELNKELGKPALGRYSFAFSHLTEQLNAAHMPMEDLVAIVQSYDLATREGRAGATAFVETFGLGAKAAENFVHQIEHGIIPTHAALVDQFNKNARALTEPFEAALNVTKDLSDVMEQLSNTVQGALAPLGEALVGKLTETGQHLTDWLQKHQATFIAMIGGIGEKLLEWGAKIAGFMASALRIMGPAIEFIKDLTVDVIQQVNSNVAGLLVWTKPLSRGFLEALQPGLGALKDIQEAANAARPSLQHLRDTDMTPGFNAAADVVDFLGHKIEGLEGPLGQLIEHSKEAGAIWSAFRVDVSMKPGEVSKIQDTLKGVGEDLVIAPEAAPEERAKAIEAVRAELDAMHIKADIDPQGKIHGFAAASQHDLEVLEQYLSTRLGPEAFGKFGGKIKFTVEGPPVEGIQEYVQNHLGMPPELAQLLGPDGILHLKYKFDPETGAPVGEPKPGEGPKPPEPKPGEPGGPGWLESLEAGPQVLGAYLAEQIKQHLLGLAPGWSVFQHGGTVGGPGGTDRVPIWATAGEKVMNLAASQRFGSTLDWMNAQAFEAGGTVLDMAGVPANMQGGAGGQIALPAGINVVSPQPMTEADTMGRAGIPDKYQGDVVEAGVTQPGVSLPTNLDVKDADRKSASDVMDGVGIPSKFQGSEGLDIPVKLSLQPGETLPGGAGASPAAGPGGPVQDQAMQALVTGGFVQMAGGGGLGEGPLHGGAKTSLSYHEPSHLAPHVGLPGTSASYWKHMLAGGFPQSEFAPLSNIISRESSWNPTNTNYTDINAQSGDNSVGLGQLTLSNYRTYGPFPQVTSVAAAQALTPYQQIAAMLNYVKARRGGSPSSAWQYWQAHGNYASGGLVGMADGGDPEGPQIVSLPRAPTQYHTASATAPPAAYSGGSPAVHNAIYQAFKEAGFPDSEWPSLVALVNHENDTWDPGRGTMGPDSDARGIFQFLSTTWPTVGMTASADPYTQAVAAMRYILQPTAQGGHGYGTPSGAWAAWQRQRDSYGHNYWRAGGPVGYQQGGAAGQLLERIVGERHWKSLRKLFGFAGGGLGEGPLHGGAKTSLSYHEPSHLAPHVGLPGTSATFWKHMAEGGMPHTDVLAGFLKGLLGELGFQTPEGGGDAGHKGFWENLLHPEGKADGGHIKGVHWPGRDSVPMNVPPGTFIMNRHRSAQYRDVIDQIMGVGMAAGGIPIITEPGERVIPPGAAPPGLLHAMNQGQLLRRAAGGQTGVLQVIYNPPGTQEYYGEAAPYGAVGPGTTQPQYYNADWSGHHGHVHTSFETGPSGEPYGVPVGSELHSPAMSGFPAWVHELGAKYGVFGTTYAGHQEHGGKNHGIDWWPVGANQDMSGASYTPEQTNRLRTFASAMRSAGAGSGAAWGSGFSATSTSTYGASTATGGGGFSWAAVRARLKSILPAWLSSALGLQMGGIASQMGGVVPSPFGGPVGGDGPAPVTEPPPPGIEKLIVPAGTPGAIPTPWGLVQFSFDFPDRGAGLGLSAGERKKLDDWIDKYRKALQTGANDLTNVHQLELEHATAAGRLAAAQDKMTKLLTPGALPESITAPVLADPKLKQEFMERGAMLEATKEYNAALADETRTSKALTKANQDLEDNRIKQNLDIEAAPKESKKVTPDENAAAMGAGLIKGMAQELGFGDVFAKPPWQWGIWKLFAGGASWGLNLLNQIGDQQGGTPTGAAAVSGLGVSGLGAATGAPGQAPGPGQPGAQADAQGVYTTPSGEKDAPNPGYKYKWKDDWVYDAKLKQWFPPQSPGGKAAAAAAAGKPADQGDQGGGPLDPKTHGGASWIFKDGHRYLADASGKQIPGREFDPTTGKEITGAPPPPAPGPQKPPGAMDVPPGHHYEQSPQGPVLKEGPPAPGFQPWEASPPGGGQQVVPVTPVAPQGAGPSASPAPSPSPSAAPPPPGFVGGGDNVIARSTTGAPIVVSRDLAQRQGLPILRDANPQESQSGVATPEATPGAGRSGPSGPAGPDWRYPGSTDVFGAPAASYRPPREPYGGDEQGNAAPGSGGGGGEGIFGLLQGLKKSFGTTGGGAPSGPGGAPGRGGGFAGIMDELMHPARNAILQARAEGRLGPAPLANVTSWLGASQGAPQTGAMTGLNLGGGGGPTLNLTQNLDPKPGDDAKKFVQSSYNDFNRAPQLSGGAPQP
jgi:SLT domain-containing protein